MDNGKRVWAPDIAEGFVIGEVCDFGTSLSLHSTTLSFPAAPLLSSRDDAITLPVL